MIFLVQFGMNKQLKIFDRPLIALALRARAILLVFCWQNLLVLIYFKLHSKLFDYLYYRPTNSKIMVSHTTAV